VSGRDAAIAAACRGWAVFPCRPNDKRPAVDCWEQRACNDPDRVARYWPPPRHNVGIATGPSGLVVLDLDTHGELPDEWQLPGVHDGRDVLAQLCEWAGQPWPSTYMVATPSGGWHLYFTAPDGAEIRNSASLLGPLVDVRGAGGYVVGAGSLVDGKPYEALDSGDLVPLPSWIGRLLAPAPAVKPALGRRGAPAGARLQGLLTTVRSGKPGDRNSPLYWASCRAAEMITAGEISQEDAEEPLVAAALEAGLRGGEAEARRTFASAMRGAGL
jgi:Bifunctional DNA primase/polymerase, N-terminal